MQRIGMVGIGRWGKNLLREFDRVAEVALCCHRGGGQNAAWARQTFPHVGLTSSYQDILGDPSISCVVLATPVPTHYPLAKEALAAGKHVFVEKPTAETAAEARELARLAGERGRVLFTGYIYLYHPVFRRVLDLTRDDAVRFARFELAKLGTFESDILSNLVVHDLAMVRELFGKPERLTVSGVTGFITDADTVTINMGFPGGREGVIDVNRLSHAKRKVCSFQTGQSFLVWDNMDLYRLDADRAFHEVYRATTTPLEVECRAFLEAVEGGPHQDPDTAADIMEMLEACRRAAGQ